MSFSGTLSTTPAIATVKLVGGSNYGSWAKAVRMWCIGQGLSEHLTTPIEKVPTDKRDAWDKADALLISLLWQSIDVSLHPLFTSYTSCYEVWTKAALLYTNDFKRLYSVISGLKELHQQGLSMTEYLGKLAALQAEFNSVLPPADSAAKDVEQRGTFFMAIALAGLSPEMSSVRDQILSSSQIPTLDDVFSRLLRVSSTESTPTSDQSILASDSSFISKPRSGQHHGATSGPNRDGRPRCSYCHRWGHVREKCYKLHGRPSRANIAQTPAGEPQSVTLTGADYHEYLQFQAAKQSSSTVSIATPDVPPPVVGISQSSSSLSPWVLDSGATDHVSGNQRLLSSFQTSSSLPIITLANGHKVFPHGVGTANPTPHLSLESVLFIPNCPFNLLSVSKLTKSLNCSILFTPNSFSIQDRSTGQTIGTGRESHGLYYLTIPVSSPSTQFTGVADISPELHHQRLGHPSLSKLRLLVPQLSQLSSLPCESCELGKQSRVSFPKKVNSRASTPFSLVHSDIWGPCRTTSTLGYQYFVTFIDDFSRCTWVYLMKNRSELFSIFQKFCAEIKTQFDVSVKVLRSDNGREYFSSPFCEFLAAQGILHQSSCPYTPQQNGVAERKNRHLVETARTLLVHHNVPLRFWADAILTACYLINRMPSSVLNNAIPMSCLYPDESLHP